MTLPWLVSGQACGRPHRVVTPEQRTEAVYRIWCEHTANKTNSDDTS